MMTTYTHWGEDAQAQEDWESLTVGMVEVPADEVADAVRAGREVWSFGYGWDDDEDFCPLDASDLWAFEDDANDTVESWGPFMAYESGRVTR